MAKSKAQNIKRMDNNCHIPDFVQGFSRVKNGGLNLVYCILYIKCSQLDALCQYANDITTEW